MKESEDLRSDLRVDDKLHEEVVYREYVQRKIEEGIKAADDGRVFSHDEVRRLFAQ